MTRPRVDVPVPALALRRPHAAGALGVSLEVFDAHVRPHIDSVRVGGVVVYPVEALQQFLGRRSVAVDGYDAAVR
jgi:hypothetical protein